MSSLLPDRRQVNVRELFEATLAEAHSALMHAMSRRMTHLLNKAVEQLLGREPYERRQHVAGDIEGGECQRCHSHRSQAFSRNGGRRRTAGIWWGHLPVRWPRVVCECGGSVKLNLLGWLQPYQRLSDEVDALIQRWGAMSLSLRQMRKELSHTYIGPLSLRTLNQRLHQLRDLTPDLTTVEAPPVLQADGIYVTQLRPNGQVRKDRKGRQRAVKGRYKRCVLIALGVWPETGRQEVLAWQLTEGEGSAAWLHFLTELEAQGLLGGSLSLIIHDGGSGLGAALRFLELGVPQQRCLFHKLKNIAKAIELPDEWPADERWRKRKAILCDFQAIWQPKTCQTVLRRYLQIYHQYRQTQPKAVATLRRDFRATLTYYQVQQTHPNWQRRFLRTTSRLERFNRSLRKRFRSAGAYHSDDGLQAAIAQTADEAFQPGVRPASINRHTVSTE
jgi:hypothetical protein